MVWSRFTFILQATPRGWLRSWLQERPFLSIFALSYLCSLQVRIVTVARPWGLCWGPAALTMKSSYRRSGRIIWEMPRKSSLTCLRRCSKEQQRLSDERRRTTVLGIPFNQWFSPAVTSKQIKIQKIYMIFAFALLYWCVFNLINNEHTDSQTVFESFGKKFFSSVGKIFLNILIYFKFF